MEGDPLVDLRRVTRPPTTGSGFVPTLSTGDPRDGRNSVAISPRSGRIAAAGGGGGGFGKSKFWGAMHQIAGH